jgi:protein gp37
MPSKKRPIEGAREVIFGNEVMAAVGKKRAGRVLDGRTWDEMPKGQG